MNPNESEKKGIDTKLLLIILIVLGALIFATLLSCVLLIAPAARSVREAADQFGALGTEADLQSVAETLKTVSAELGAVDWETIAGNLESVSAELGAIEWEAIAKNIDRTATDAQAGMKSALEAIDEIDIPALNSAIEDLHSVIKPLAKLINLF